MKRRPFLPTLILAMALMLSLLVAPGIASTAAAAPSVSKAATKSKVKVDKKATLNLLPVAYGKKQVATAKFTTGYKGRVVGLQYKDGTKWRQAASATMDSKGRVTFTLKAIKNNKTYRAVADTHKVRNTKTGKTKTWGVTLLVDSRYQEGTTRRDVIETQEVHPGVQG